MGRQRDKGSLLERQAKDTTQPSDSSKDNFPARFPREQKPTEAAQQGPL